MFSTVQVELCYFVERVCFKNDVVQKDCYAHLSLVVVCLNVGKTIDRSDAASVIVRFDPREQVVPIGVLWAVQLAILHIERISLDRIRRNNIARTWTLQ